MMEQTYQRINLAQEQLNVALELFLDGRSYVSSLTLAGAAEEIFGKALFARGEETVLDRNHSAIAPVEELFREKPYSLKEFVNEKNRVRNAAKHMRDQFETEVFADLEDEALWMLARACDNYGRLDLPQTDRMHEFNEWFYEHVIGV